MNFKSHLKFNKQERSGIFFLLLIILCLQLGYFVYRSFNTASPSDSLSVDPNTQHKIDLLKEKAKQRDSLKIYPFNPNFITDYKGYTLGMSVEEIDRLHSFRKQNRFANSPEEFQQVTLISDSLLDAISPYFKFPEWTGNKPVEVANVQDKSHFNPPDPAVPVLDLNKATPEDLKMINGIGDKLSDRIIKFRDRLGGFLIEEQLYDVYGLEADVAERTLKRFKLLSTPVIEKIDINKASVAELTKLVYIRYSVAQEIVLYREAKGKINSFEELKNIHDFPSDKIDRLALYLSL